MFSVCQFHAVINGLPHSQFNQLVEHHHADRGRYRFRCRDQLLVMLFAQLAGLDSLRTLAAAFNCQPRQHYHLGTQPLRRSTLADANARTDPALFGALAAALMAQAPRRQRQSAEDLLLLLDSTSLTLKGAGFDQWSRLHCTSHTQGLKLHVLYDLRAEMPVLGILTAPTVNDLEQGRRLTLTRGATYVFDKGYYDYNWWHQIDQAEARFVTRFKRNAGLRVVQARAVPAPGPILADEDVVFAHAYPSGGRRNAYAAKPLRRVTVSRGQRSPLVLATNDLVSPADLIAQHYRQRWGIELFFKWIKQHLRIKRFLGRSENAVRIQVLTALIAFLLVYRFHQINAAGSDQTSLWLCLSTLRVSLFERVLVARSRPPPAACSANTPLIEKG